MLIHFNTFFSRTSPEVAQQPTTRNENKDSICLLSSVKTPSLAATPARKRRYVERMQQTKSCVEGKSLKQTEALSLSVDEKGRRVTAS